MVAPVTWALRMVQSVPMALSAMTTSGPMLQPAPIRVSPRRWVPGHSTVSAPTLTPGST